MKSRPVDILIGALKRLSGDQYYPWNGEDAIDMKEEAELALKYYHKAVEKDEHNRE